MTRRQEQRKGSAQFFDRLTLDGIRHMLGLNPLYDEMTDEEYRIKRRRDQRLAQKPYHQMTEVQKEMSRERVRNWRARQRLKAG